MPFFPHRLRQFRTVLGHNQDSMAGLIGMQPDTYAQLERGTHTMEHVHQENFISRFGKDVYSYIHGELDRIEFGGKELRRETAVGDGFEGLTDPNTNLNFDLKEVDGLQARYRESPEKDKEKIYKKLVLAYKSLEAENQKLRNQNNVLRQALVDAKNMMIQKFVKKEKK